MRRSYVLLDPDCGFVCCLDQLYEARTFAEADCHKHGVSIENAQDYQVVSYEEYWEMTREEDRMASGM